MVLSDIAFRRSLVKENEEKKVGKDKRDTLYLVSLRNISADGLLALSVQLQQDMTRVV